MPKDGNRKNAIRVIMEDTGLKYTAVMHVFDGHLETVRTTNPGMTYTAALDLAYDLTAEELVGPVEDENPGTPPQEAPAHE